MYDINIAKAAYNGVKFYVSDNGVILTPGQGEKGILAPEYFRSVQDMKTGNMLYQAELKLVVVIHMGLKGVFN